MPFWLNGSAIPIGTSLYFSGPRDDVSIGLRHFMPDDEFTDVARQLEEKLLEMNQATDPIIRRTLLSDMRKLTADADRLAAEGAPPKKAAKTTPEKR